MNKRTKTIFIVIAIAGAAYLAYRWYVGRQTSGTPQLGTNLNSVAPELIGGSTGPQSGLNYYAGATNVYVTEAVTQNSVKPPWPAHKGT